MINLLIGGDIAPTVSNYRLFSEGNLEELVGVELGEILSAADYSIFNLETPLTDQETPIFKAGPNLRAPLTAVNGIKKISPYFYCLANNHIMDHGSQGLYATIEIFEKHGIAYAGAGKNAKKAAEAHIFEKNGVKIGIYCCAEHEFSIATDDSPGANGFDPLESLDHIVKLRTMCDFLVVLYHGGKEHYRYPSPYLRKVCRKIVDKGADLVVCQHSHCIGCEEDWKHGKIIYGQGNFLFDHSDSEFWQTSLLLQVNLGDSSFEVNYIPVCKNGRVIRKADEVEAKSILGLFHERSSDIQQLGFVEQEYTKFSEQTLNEYMTALSGKIVRNPFYRIINKLSGYKWSPWFASKRYRKLDRVILQNYIECEAHRELIIEGLKFSIKDIAMKAWDK